MKLIVTSTIVFFVLLGIFTYLINRGLKYKYEVKFQKTTSEYFKDIAEHDSLTGAKSRNAYETDVKKYDAYDEAQRLKLCVLVMDINYMKKINDMYGLSTGDTILKIVYDVSLQSFGAERQCYRTGGDEFVIVAQDGEISEKEIEYFKTKVSKEAEKLNLVIDVAVGMSTYDPYLDHSLADTVRRTDQRMYADKMQIKEQVIDKLPMEESTGRPRE